VAALNLVGLGAWSNEASGIPLTVPFYSLTTQINGSGSINNLNQPPVFSCSTSSCSESFKYGTEFTLHATPSSLYTFAGWSESCSGVSDCVLKLTSNLTVSATFDRMALVQVLSDPTPYYDLQAAYDATSKNAEFNARNIIFNGDFTLNKSIDIILNGGLDSDFTTISGVTTIHGVLKIKSGKLIVNRLRIQ
jgi:hypothetical protein